MTDNELDQVVGRAMRHKRKAESDLEEARRKAEGMAQQAETVVVALRKEYQGKIEEDEFVLSAKGFEYFELCAYPTAEEVVATLNEIKRLSDIIKKSCDDIEKLAK